MAYTKVPKDVLPTLIIGLGGTGYQVIKRVKELFKKRYDSAKLPIRYLLIDTDLKSFLDDTIENNEKCQLRFGEGIKKTLDWAYSNDNFDWLPQNPKITPDFFTSTDQGAGLMRPIGRLYLCKNAKLVYDILSTAKNDLVDLHKVLTDLGETYLENIDRHKVYIVGSLAGGTGCGTYLDVAVMLSKIFNRDTTNIIGMFTLESCYDDKLSSDLDSQNRSKANCYAALKELEFYMSSITSPEDEKYNFKYTNIGEIRLDKKLLDICYLVENKNELGGVLSNIDDIYDLCSLQLFQEVGTTLGSQLRADYANFICKDKDPVLKKDRHFSTFSSSSMEFPVDKLKRFCSYNLAGEILKKLTSEMQGSTETLELEAEQLANNINTAMDIAAATMNFGGNLKVSPKIYYNDMLNKLGNLKIVDNIIEEKLKAWSDGKENCSNAAEKLMKDYASEKTTVLGIKSVCDVLKRVQSAFYRDYTETIVNTSINSGKIEGDIKGIKNKRIIKGKDMVNSDFVNNFNKYIDQEQNRIINTIYKERYELINCIIEEINKGINELLSNINNIQSDIKNGLNRLSYQSQKKYGGNIISREMVTKDYYREYYEERFLPNFESKIAAIFKNLNLLELLSKGPSELITLCEEEFENNRSDMSILDLLRRNAKEKEMTLEDYIKNELDITAKLAKPFWSAVKNPEVSWTECYYMGYIRDENGNNGFTAKPPEAMDRWIRNQTGERSRQARYVETTNPYAIDVIHITMGACASYLPDVRHYKQYYIKLLASKTYPLHLDERYIGLEELDLDIDKMLQYYSLAKAYGAIFELENSFYLNITMAEGRYQYIYSSKYCLQKKEYLGEELQTLPENKSNLPEDLKICEGYAEMIKTINENSVLNSIIEGFIKDTEKKFKKEELKSHCLSYIEDKLAKDFIAKEKITHRMLTN